MTTNEPVVVAPNGVVVVATVDRNVPTRLAVDASDLELAPGEWPMELVTSRGGQATWVFRMTCGQDGATYRSRHDDADVEVIVFND